MRKTRMTDDRNSSSHENMKAKLRTLEVGSPEKPLKEAFESLASRDVLTDTQESNQGEVGTDVDGGREEQTSRETDTKQAN